MRILLIQWKQKSRFHVHLLKIPLEDYGGVIISFLLKNQGHLINAEQKSI